MKVEHINFENKTFETDNGEVLKIERKVKA